MLRILFSAAQDEGDLRMWWLSEDAFLERIDTLVARGFEAAPAGKVRVEAVDRLDRIQWRAYYWSARGLVMLARQIRQGRSALSRRRSTRRP